ncbi:MAG: peptidoglycan editing factor PgeF [Gammaproteobacteria bacterium]|nr:peptidoglycan editing factor PgeF [Gammaproteobacteria bacterium]
MFFIPEWPVPEGVNALCTNRQGGVSHAPFDGFNLAIHVGDHLEQVLVNRQTLFHAAKLPSQPVWLDQKHTTRAIQLPYSSPHVSLDGIPVSQASISERSQSSQQENFKDIQTTRPGQLEVADASWTEAAGLVSVVMTADCLPILITNQSGTLVSAIHAGWKGLAEGIISQTLASFPQTPRNQPEQLIAWIGPAISAEHFEVGEEVREQFVAKDSDNAQFFQSKQPRQSKQRNKSQQHECPVESQENCLQDRSVKYLADLPGLAKLELQKIGVRNITLSGLCTYALADQFYSYRRSGKTGRIASLIWLD